MKRGSVCNFGRVYEHRRHRCFPICAGAYFAFEAQRTTQGRTPSIVDDSDARVEWLLLADQVSSPTAALWHSSSHNLDSTDWPLWRRSSDRSGSVVDVNRP